LVSSLERDPLLAQRLKNLRTVPGVGPITALTWALEIGDVSRFRSVKQAISYCGCAETKRAPRTKCCERRSPNSETSISSVFWYKPPNSRRKQSHELALVYEKAKQKENTNRATIAVARKMVTYLLAVDRASRPFVPAENFSTAAA
jgi:transposase